MSAANSRTLESPGEKSRPVSPEARARYECVVGLEVHVQLATATKAFCSCSTRFGDPPNTNVCPVCLGLPGALPVFNARALDLAIKAALALHCEVQERSRFARKNYFYPDLPKGYQISQFELPLAARGWLEIQTGGEKKRIGITRLHLEEDAAKNLHEGFADAAEYSHIDFNRCGVPLIEIVSEPDIRSPEEAYAYLTDLKQSLQYTEVSDCNMEAGSLRCDANVSVRLRGSKDFGAKVEVKNLNSFRFLTHALEYEVERQIGIVESGASVVQETRLWNVAAGRTESMRSKEFAHDYRYFPEPDLLPVIVTPEHKAKLLSGMPELPDAKRARFEKEYALSLYDSEVLTGSVELAHYFEAVVRAGAPPKTAANWIQTELLRRLNETNKSISDSPVLPKDLAQLLKRVEAQEITPASAKKVFAKMFETGQPSHVVIEAEGLLQMKDPEQVEVIVKEVIQDSPGKVAEFRSGNEGIFKAFIGQVMQKTRGRANAQQVNRVMREQLRINHERQVANNFLNRLNAETSQSLSLLRMGSPPEPDIVIGRENGETEIGLEITSTYLNQNEAQFVWDDAVKTLLATPKGASSWSSGIIANPDKEYERRLYDAIQKKSKKQYSTRETWLAVEFNYWLGNEKDAQDIVSRASQRLQHQSSPFKSVWAVWQVTNVSPSSYKIFKVW